VSMLRVFAPGDYFGDAYEWCCTVQHRGDTVEFLGQDKAITPSAWRAILAECREQGIKAIEFERKSGARTGRHKLDL
jgi:hypothetical protein